MTEIPVSPECRLAICLYGQKIQFSEQLVQCHRKCDGFCCKIRFAQHLQQLQTRQAITYTSVCFPLQCIFVLLSNRTFNSDTNTFFQKLCTNTLYSFYKLCRLKAIFSSAKTYLTRTKKTYEAGKAREN